MPRLSRIYTLSLDILWAVALIALPLTTFPLFGLKTGAIVAPFSAAPVLLLVILWLLPSLFFKRKKIKLPVEAWPLFLFALVALLSSAAAYFIEIPSLKNSTPFSQEVRALTTLVIGMAFYLVCATWPRDSQKLRRSLQLINIGGIIMILWTLTQVVYILTKAEHYPGWVLAIQNIVAMKPDYFFYQGYRTSGLAYEASWFAHQLVILYIPIWLASTIERTSAWNFRILRIKSFQGFSAENILLPVAFFEFMLSSPRISLVSLLLIFFLLFIIVNVRLVRKIIRALMNRSEALRTRSYFRAGISFGISVLLLLIYLGFVVGAFYLMSQRDWRLALLFKNEISWTDIRNLLNLDETTIITYASRLAFLERSVYWLTGWHVFNDYPWLGVGLGNAGFFLAQKMPSIGWSSYEIRNLLDIMISVPNIKGFWIRLLAETGLLGFYIFAGWYYLMGKSALLLRSSKDGIAKIISLAGLLALAAYLSEGFSIDSFAMPYFWIAMGLVTAMSMAYRQPSRNEDLSS